MNMKKLLTSSSTAFSLGFAVNAYGQSIWDGAIEAGVTGAVDVPSVGIFFYFSIGTNKSTNKLLVSPWTGMYCDEYSI